MELETCRPNSLEIKAGEQLPRASLPAAGKRRACGWRKEAKVKPCAEQQRKPEQICGSAPWGGSCGASSCEPDPDRNDPVPVRTSAWGTPAAPRRCKQPLLPLAGRRRVRGPRAEVPLGARPAGAGGCWLQLLWRGAAAPVPAASPGPAPCSRRGSAVAAPAPFPPRLPAAGAAPAPRRPAGPGARQVRNDHCFY